MSFSRREIRRAGSGFDLRFALRETANYTQKYSEETLESWRWRGDAIADAAVEAIFENGHPNGGIHNLLLKVEEIASRRKGEMGFNAEHKHACEAFLVEIEKVGLRIDMAEVAKGQRSSHAMHLSSVSHCLRDRSSEAHSSGRCRELWLQREIFQATQREGRSRQQV